jgi:hypothetical protein
MKPSPSERLWRVAYAETLAALYREQESARALAARRNELHDELAAQRERDERLPEPLPEIL